MTLSVAPAKTTEGEDQGGRCAGGQGAGDDAGHRPGRSVSPVRRRAAGWLVGWVWTVMTVSLSQSVVHCCRAWSANAFAHPGQMAGMPSRGRGPLTVQVGPRESYPGQERSSWASSPREVMPALAKTLRRWNATVLGETQIWAATSLLESPEDDQLGDLELHRGQLDQGGGVPLAGGLAGGAQLRGRPLGRAVRRAGRRTSPGRGAGVRARRPGVGRDAATRRRRGGCGLRRRARPARGVVGQGVGEQGSASPACDRRGRWSSRGRRRRWPAPTAGRWRRRTRRAPRPTRGPGRVRRRGRRRRCVRSRPCGPARAGAAGRGGAGRRRRRLRLPRARPWPTGSGRGPGRSGCPAGAAATTSSRSASRVS